jgi:hypothetical protein
MTKPGEHWPLVEPTLLYSPVTKLAPEQTAALEVDFLVVSSEEREENNTANN